MPTLNLAILGSTNGTDAAHILSTIKDGILEDVSVKCIISNRSKAKILEKGKDYNVDTLYLAATHKDGTSMTREEYDQKLHEILSVNYKIDYIILIGWMRILSCNFVSLWKNRILNIHPSLLPAYAGAMNMNVHRSVIERGCKITGATLIFIDDGPDTGPIIDQMALRIENTDTAESLKDKVQDLEKKLFTKNLPLIRDGKLKVVKNIVICE